MLVNIKEFPDTDVVQEFHRRSDIKRYERCIEELESDIKQFKNKIEEIKKEIEKLQ